MKIIIFIIFILSAQFAFSQNSDASLNGKIFTGTATEIISPEMSRKPVVYNDVIRFDNGKIYSDLFNVYSADDCDYTSKVDERRMIALRVISFSSAATGTIDGKNVTLVFNGEVIGDVTLSGVLTIKYPDKREVSFDVSAASK